MGRFGKKWEKNILVLSNSSEKKRKRLKKNILEGVEKSWKNGFGPMFKGCSKKELKREQKKVIEMNKCSSKGEPSKRVNFFFFGNFNCQLKMIKDDRKK